MKIVRDEDESESKGKGKKAKVVDTVPDDSTAIVKFDIETAVIVALDEKYKDIKVTDGKSYAFIMKGIAEYRELRLKIDDRHKVLKKDALEYGRRVDAEKNRLKGLLEPGENHLKEVRQVEDDRKAEIKAAKEAIEQARVDKIRSRINDLQSMLIELPEMCIEELQNIEEGSEALNISVIDYEEFTEEAQALKGRLCEAVKKSIKSMEARKAEEARLEKIQIEQEAAQKKIDEANQKLQEKEAALEKKEWERTEKIRIAKEMAEEKVKVEKEQEIEADRLEKEIVEQNALMPDKEKLLSFIDILGDTPIPRVETKEASDLLNQIVMRLTKLVLGAKTRANKL